MRPVHGRAGAWWVHPLRNLFSIAQDLWLRHEVSGAAMKSLVAPAVWATFAPDDPLLGLVDLPLLLSRLIRRLKA